MVEYILLVVYSCDAEAGLCNGKPGLRVLHPEQRQAERASIMLLVVHSRGSPM
jgi:hypothetical protein